MLILVNTEINILDTPKIERFLYVNTRHEQNLQSPGAPER